MSMNLPLNNNHINVINDKVVVKLKNDVLLVRKTLLNTLSLNACLLSIHSLNIHHNQS